MHGRWLTPNSPTLPIVKVTRTIKAPAEFLEFLAGAFLLLTDANNWERFGDMLPDDIAQEFETILDSYLNS